MSVTIESPMNNMTNVDLGNLTIVFSYKTPIAFYGSNGLVIRQNDWSATTGKHLNYIHPNKDLRVTGDEFNRLLALELAPLGL